jgi:hypothetical protein
MKTFLLATLLGLSCLVSRANAAPGYSAAALYNQGNACARAGKTGQAILNYERAQLLAPNDSDIAANLHFVRAKAGLRDLQVSCLNWAPPDTIAWIGSFGVLIAGAGFLLKRRTVTFAGALLVTAAIGNAITLWPKMSEAVVMIHEVPAFASPVVGGDTLFKLHEGENVTVRAEQKDFSLVQNSTGRSGWVGRADISFVVPQSGHHSQPMHRT